MRFGVFLTVLFLYTSLFAQSPQIHEKYAQSKYCAACHPEQARDWKTTWHSKSHTSQNILYKKTLEYMSKKLYKDTQKLSVECAKCHNPRISVKKVNKNFLLSKAFGVENKDTKKVKKALNTSYLKEGINCIVCHNTDKISHSHDLLKRGFDAVEWGPNHVMVGPFDSERTNYHKSVKRDHFNENVNRLCFVCHYGGENKYKLPVYTTGAEYEEANSTKKCADCHMSERRKGIIAPHIKKEGVLTVEREIRSHLFAGVRNSDIAKSAFDMSLKQEDKALTVTLKNKTPHKVPTGYGGRALIVEVVYHRGDNVVDRLSKVLDVTFADQHGKKTIPYLAKSIKDDLRLKPNEIRTLRFDLLGDSDKAIVTVWYQLVNDDLKNMLEITDPIFSKKYEISQQTIKLN